MTEEQKTQNIFFRRLIFIMILVGLGAVIFVHLKFFVGAFLGAATLYIVLRRVMWRLTDRYLWHPWMASLTLVLGITVLLLGIGYLVFEVTAAQVANIDSTKLLPELHRAAASINAKLGIDVMSGGVVDRLTEAASAMVSILLTSTYSFFFNLLMMMFVLYFMLSNGRQMETNMMRYIPLKGDALLMVKKEIHDVVFSNAIGIPLVMLAQAAVALAVYTLFGISNAPFWAFLTAICGLLPVVGSALVYVPLGVIMIWAGNIWPGIGIMFFGLMFIGNVDNLVRIVVMKKIADTHPLIVIFGVLAGIPIFGFWGIIFGPLLLSGFLLLLHIYYMENHLFPSGGGLPKRTRAIVTIKRKSSKKQSHEQQ